VALVAAEATQDDGAEMKARLASALRLLGQRIYALGALAVYRKRWAELRQLVLIRPAQRTYYWLREISVLVMRQKLQFQMFFSETVGLLNRLPQLLPERAGRDDDLLSLLADFDVLALVVCLAGDANEEFPHWPILLWEAAYRGMEILVALISDGTFAGQLLDGGQGDLRALLQRFQRTMKRAANEQHLAWRGIEDTPKLREFIGIWG
jgi:hypothetical protein